MGFDVNTQDVVNDLNSQSTDTSAQDTSQTDAATSAANPAQTGAAQSNPAAQASPKATPQEILELEKVAKFKFEGKDWTAADLKKAYMLQSDYSRKTKEIAQERKFYDALSSDLELIKRDPRLVAEFKKIYPEKFHSYLRYVHTEQPEQVEQEQDKVDPRYSKLESEVTELRSYFKEQETQAAAAEIDARISEMSKKYPEADEETVLVRAERLLERKKEDNPGQKVKLTPQDWEGLFKSVHDHAEARYKSRQEAQLKTQVQANKQGKDTPAGGGIPGQAPRKYRSIKEASEALRQVEGF